MAFWLIFNKKPLIRRLGTFPTCQQWHAKLIRFVTKQIPPFADHYRHTPKQRASHTHPHRHTHSTQWDGCSLSLIVLYSKGLAADNPNWTVHNVAPNTNSDAYTHITRGFRFQNTCIQRIQATKKQKKNIWGNANTIFLKAYAWPQLYISPENIHANTVLFVANGGFLANDSINFQNQNT